MLNRHLQAQTRATANHENVLHLGEYRVTVLGERLFRIEKNSKRIFRDAATQAVWFRDMPRQRFACVDSGEKWRIETDACALILPKDGGQVCVEMDGKVIFADNKGNLSGTYRTLDCCNGDVHFTHWKKGDIPYAISLSMGVCSTSGVAYLDDSASLTLDEQGRVRNERAVGEDGYIFAFGKEYRGAVRAFFELTGYPPLVPRFALGNWWSRYHVYTDREYFSLLSKFEEREIPLSVATVDMDWHYADKLDEEMEITKSGKRTPERVGTPSVNLGWTGYTWNRNLFPDPKDFLQKIKKKGLKITLNVHPADGVRYWDTAYAAMAKEMGIDPQSERQVPFAFTDERFINAYFDILHRPHETDGVDFWWIDWQQPNIPWTGEAEGTEYDPLWALNHYHYLDNAKGSKTPLILSRFGGAGSHRYPLGFSGDTYITWETLAYLPYFTATASNIGYTWWSHDIGGHMEGEKEDELYARHLQYGVFSPILRLHCTNADTMTKEPWAYKNGTGYIAEKFLKLRHELVPYLYTASCATHEKGRALIEPLYYAYDNEAAYRYIAEYFFGEELLVLPVTTKREKDGYARTQGWLPEGKWTDIFTGDVYEAGCGGKELTFYRTLDEIPALIKAGGILPLSKDKGNGCKNPVNLEIWSYEGEGEYTLYEDGKETEKEGAYRTKFVAKQTKRNGARTQSLTISGEGDFSVVPQERTLFIRFKDIENATLRLLENGKEIKVEEMLTDCPALRVAWKEGVEYTIEATYTDKTPLERFQRRAQEVLVQAEGNNAEKYQAYVGICKADCLKTALDAVEKSALAEIVKLRLKETI